MGVCYEWKLMLENEGLTLWHSQASPICPGVLSSCALVVFGTWYDSIAWGVALLKKTTGTEHKLTVRAAWVGYSYCTRLALSLIHI